MEDGGINVKKRYIVFLLCILSISITTCFAGCANVLNNNGKDNENQTPEGMTRIYDIELVVASPNEDHIYCVDYPSCYYVFGQHNERVKFEREYEAKHYVKDEDLQYLLDYIYDHNDLTDREDDSLFTYSLTVCYFDENDEMLYEKAWGYDTFPAELNGVIDKINEMCGEDVMPYPSDVISDIPEFIYSETGLTENDYPREDIEKMWADQNFVAMDKMLSEYYGIDGMMSIYYSNVAREDISDYVPTELRDAKSISDVQFETFVNAYLKVLNDEMGENWSLTFEELDPDGLNMINRDGHPTHGFMYIAKAESVKDFRTNVDGDQYVINVPDGELEQSCYFVYNEDASCVLVGYTNAGNNFNEYVKKFVSLGVNSEE